MNVLKPSQYGKLTKLLNGPISRVADSQIPLSAKRIILDNVQLRYQPVGKGFQFCVAA